MNLDMITPLIGKFDDLINSLIDDFKEFNFDENALVFIAKKTRNFITFNELTLSNILFSILEKIDDTEYSFDDEISKSKDIINSIYDNINASLDKILEHDEEEHEHEHHHHHIDVDSLQDDVKDIVSNLELLKEFFSRICDITVSVVKYQTNGISEDAFKDKYDDFKEYVKNFSNI